MIKKHIQSIVYQRSFQAILEMGFLIQTKCSIQTKCDPPEFTHFVAAGFFQTP